MAKAKEAAEPSAIPPDGVPGQGSDSGKAPPFGTAKPAAVGGKVPRVIHELERAPHGLKRFKIRCENYGSQMNRYVLAADETGAVSCFREYEKIDAELARLKKIGGQVDEPALVVRELPD